MGLLQAASETSLPFVVKLSFYETRTKQGIVRPYQEKVFWEEWRIRLRLVQSQSASGATLRCRVFGNIRVSDFAFPPSTSTKVLHGRSKAVPCQPPWAVCSVCCPYV